MRRTGRTTQLILNAVKELLSGNTVHFVDHPRDDGRTHTQDQYRALIEKFVSIISASTNIEKSEVRNIYYFKIGTNGYGIDIGQKPDRLTLRALMTIGEKK